MCIEAARRVKARGHLMGQALIAHETVVARRSNGFLIETLCVEFPAFDTAISADTSAYLSPNVGG